MAQSSNYKQYNRSTRVLTEESGFAGGMLWTGNNIDETHLKAIVNCDYDDTTGYLKTRDPFVVKDDSPTLENVIGAAAGIELDLTDYKLLGVHNICAFDFLSGEVESDTIYSDDYDAVYSDALSDGDLQGAGVLYIFVKTIQTSRGVHSVPFNQDTAICIYYDGEVYHRCEMAVDDVTLHNITAANILTNYENQLYGLGTRQDSVEEESSDAKPWLHVYRLLRKEITPMPEGAAPTLSDYAYTLKQYRYADTVVESESEDGDILSELHLGYVQAKIDAVTLLEACVSGFNAARGKDTFKYTSTEVQTPDVPYILGVYFTDEDGDVLVSPRIGQKVTVHVPTAYLSDSEDTLSYLALFQLKDNSESAPTDLVDPWQYMALGEAMDGEFTFEFIFQKKKTILGFTYYGTIQPPLEDENNNPIVPLAYTDDAVDTLMPYTVTANDGLSNLKVKSYDLSSADGSCIWKNRMCVWGTQSSHNCLFLSEVDNFYYYPVPNNVALFDANIISCIPYKDSLLVFTANKIYRVLENNDGTFSQTVIQNDMPLSKEDSAHLTAIKNMVLFKSGNYFYMIVPKSQSLTDELSIAPIYKNIAGFLNTIDKSVQEVLQLLYPEYLFTSCSVVNQTPTAVYSEQDTVHILYDVVAAINTKENTSEIRLFKMFLNYNTNLRAWTLYLEETTEASLEVATLTAARLMSFVRINRSQTLHGDDAYRAPFSLVTQQPVVTTDNNFRILLDTGYRTLSTAVQKRFREVQLKLYNSTESITSFGTAFLVDGVWRRSYSKLEEVLLDTNGISQVSLMPALDLNTFVTELSMPVNEMGEALKAPGSDSIELSDWTLDFSHFKREAPITVRVPVSGKGYNPRFIFMTPNAAGLTINEVNWVYRLMHGR